MENHDFFKHVKKELKDIFNEYNFEETNKQVFNSSNCFLILESEYCKIKIGKDQGDLFVHMSSIIDTHIESDQNEFKEWYTLDEIIDFLNEKHNLKKIKIVFNDLSDTNIEKDLKKIKLILNSNINKIIRLFNADTFRNEKYKLNQFSKKRSEAIIDLFS